MTLTYAAPEADTTLRSLSMAVAVVALGLLTLYLVGFDQGAVSRTGMLLHELMHDGRHLMSVPCH